MALRVHGGADLLRNLRLDAGGRRRHGLRQDLRSNVFALDRSTGALRWERRYHARNDGPNGLAVTSDGVYGATDTDAFALDADTGRSSGGGT